MPGLVIVGAGGFGREVLDVVDAINASSSQQIEIVGFVDDGDPDTDLLANYEPILGGIEAVDALHSDVGYVIGIGNPRVRRALDERLRGNRTSPVLVHPSTSVGRRVEMGPGTVVCAQVAITNNIRLGRHTHVNLGCTIGHDVVVDDYVTLSPKVSLSGNVRAHDGAFFGTGAVVNPAVAVGEDAVVGSGAAVIRDVRAGTTVVGVPARPRA